MSEPVGVMKCFECIEKHGRDMEHHLEDLVRVSKSPEERLRYEEWIDRVREIRRYAHQNAKDISIDNPVLGRPPFDTGEVKPLAEVGKKVWVERPFPKEECDPRSFRVIKPNPEHIVTLCCAKGHWDEMAGRCAVSQEVEKIEHLHPKGEGSCPVCGT